MPLIKASQIKSVVIIFRPHVSQSAFPLRTWLITYPSIKLKILPFYWFLHLLSSFYVFAQPPDSPPFYSKPKNNHMHLYFLSLIHCSALSNVVFIPVLKPKLHYDSSVHLSQWNLKFIIVHKILSQTNPCNYSLPCFSLKEKKKKTVALISPERLCSTTRNIIDLSSHCFSHSPCQ